MSVDKRVRRNVSRGEARITHPDNVSLGLADIGRSINDAPYRIIGEDSRHSRGPQE
jgi:hypothetical protein